MLHKLYHFITAKYNRYRVGRYLNQMKRSGVSWKNIDGVWLPLWDTIGYDTLRWIVDGNYEIGEMTILKNRLSDDDVVLEIGTGLGFLSTYCALKNGNHKIHTYEANPENILIAQKVFEKNDVQPCLHNQMLGASNDSIKFFVNDESKLASSLLKTTGQEIFIEQLPINKVINELNPTYLLMDIEGAEYDIISIINFQSIKKVQFELHPHLIGDEKSTFIFNKLEQMGFVRDTVVSSHPNYFYSKP